MDERSAPSGKFFGPLVHLSLEASLVPEDQVLSKAPFMGCSGSPFCFSQLLHSSLVTATTLAWSVSSGASELYSYSSGIADQSSLQSKAWCL